MKGSHHDSKKDPLEQAREIQNEGKIGIRENHKRPIPLKRQFGTAQTQISSKRRRNIQQTSQKRTPSSTLSLCASNSDTESDSDNRKVSVMSQLSPSEQTSTRSGQSKIERKIAQKDQSTMPPYPTSRMEPSTRPDQKQSDEDENDVEIVDKETFSQTTDNRKSCKSKKRRQSSGASLDNYASHNKIEGQNYKAKEETSKVNFELHNNPIDGPIPRKNPPVQNVVLNNGMKVPALKATKLPKKKKRKFYSDVKEMGDDSDEGNNDNTFGLGSATSYIGEMKDVIDSCENDTGNKVYRIDSAKRTTRSSHSRDMHRSSSTLSIKKVNGRPRRAGKLVVPGRSFTSPTQSREQKLQKERQLQWRSTKDQDEHHTSKKETSAEDWDPINGGSHAITSGMTTRRKKQYGTAVRNSADLMESPVTRRQKRSKKQKKPETIDICSSESEDDAIVVTEKEEGDVNEFNLKRLVIEKRVYNNQDNHPTVTFNHDEGIMEITFYKRNGHKNIEEKIRVSLSEIEEPSYWTPSDTATKNYPDLDSFIWMRSNITMKSMSKRKGSNLTKNVALVLEFGEDQHMLDLLTIARENGADPASLPPDDLELSAELLIKDSQKEYKLRSKVKPHKVDQFIQNRQSDEILVVYPFEGDIGELEAAAEGLKELSWMEKSEEDTQDLAEAKNPTKSDSETLHADNESSENALIATKSGQRSHFIEVRVEDYERLDTGQWLNDSLVDMWMQWISRHITCKRSSNVHFFTSHFYTTLVSEGVEGVKSWTAKKNIDIFNKKLIFIPINKTLHWSLCVVVNPGAITPQVDDEDPQFPCMLFFDSLNMHRKSRVHGKVLKWLNSEWKRTQKTDAELFNRKSCKMYDPEVPRQNNGSDCGVFVCRYAFAMFQLRHLKFSRRDAELEQLEVASSPRRQSRRVRRSQEFASLITNGKEFDFDVGDIQRIRRDFKTLIQKLHPRYQSFKENRIKAEKEERKARKRRTGKATNASEQGASVESDAVAETSSAPSAMNLNGTHGKTPNDLSDSSSKENFIPRAVGDNSSQKMTTPNDEERHEVAVSEALQQQCSLETQEIDRQPGLHPSSMGDGSAGSVTHDEKIHRTLSTTSVVQGEEMADNEDIVHL